MASQADKLRRLALVARRYYLEDQKQSDIALELGISRPLVSRMLTEAREKGVVEIRINDPAEQSNALLVTLQSRFSLRGGALVEDGEDDQQTNRHLSRETFRLLGELEVRHMGIGWGHSVGQLVTYLETEGATPFGATHICPLMGNAGIAIRNYHSNENVRIMAERLNAAPHFLYLPAVAESFEEKQLLCSTELYRQVEREWTQLDTALVNIGNYPSTPDFASVARYGDLLQKQKACGRLLAYFFNQQGQIIHSDHDFAIQIPLELLTRCRNVVGLCSANTSLRALQGALSSGVFTHLVSRENLVRNLVEFS